MAKCILFGCAYFLPLLVFGRIINGTIRDDNHLHPLGNIAVSIYLEADSTLIATDTTGESGSFHLHWSTLSINHDLTTPNHFQLYPNYPNPFNPSTMVPLEVPTTGNYTLTAFNLLGQVISRKSFMLNSGVHTISYGGGGPEPVFN